MSAAMWIEHLSAAATDLFPTLADAAIKGVAVLMIAGAAAIALRRSSAATRHLIWFLGVVSLLILPLLSASLPGWHVLPAFPIAVAVEVTPQAAALPLPWERAGVRVPDGAASRTLRAEPMDAPQMPPVESPTPAVGGVADPAYKPVGGVADPALPVDNLRRFPVYKLRSWLILAWLAGSALLLAHLMLGYLSLCWLARHAERITEDSWTTLLRHLSSQLGVRRRVELLTSGQRTMPMTWGLWRTRLLLPADAADWPRDQRRTVLLHELAHAKRWDCLMQFITQLALALYWFNPFLWLAWRRMQTERERACDDLVLSAGTKASAYAEQLLHIASAMPAVRFSAAAIAMARPSKLEGRLLAILDVKRNRRTVTLSATLLGAALLVGVAVPLAMLRASASTTQPTVENQTRIHELIYVLRHATLLSRQEHWCAAIKELAEIGKPAVPWLVRELDHSDGLFEKSAIAFALRAIGDPRAVPSLIRALPRSPDQIGSFGLILANEDVHRFMAQHACWPGPTADMFTFNWPLTELDGTLRKITGHSEGDMNAKTNSRADQAAATKAQQEIAERWKGWWATNRQKYVSDVDLAGIEDRPSVQGDLVEAAGLAKFGPIFAAGQDVRLGPVHDLVLPAEKSIDVKAFLDFDTGRRFSQFEGGRWNSDRDYARWLQQAGIDARVMGDMLVGSDVHAWVVDNALWEKLPDELARQSTIDPGRRGPSSDFYPPRNEGGAHLQPDALPVTFLFTTREGGRGILQILSQEKQPQGFHIRYRMFQSPRLPAVKATTLPTQPVRTGLAFGPERQVTLNDPRGNMDAALNFDTGRTFALPAGAYEAGYEKWLDASDASIMVLMDSGRDIMSVIRGSKISLHQVAPEAWDRLTPAEVVELAERFSPSRHNLQALQIFPSLPQTGVFQTPQGTAGLVQIIEANGQRHDTKPLVLVEGKYPMTLILRYKLVQDDRPATAPGTTRPTTQPAAQSDTSTPRAAALAMLDAMEEHDSMAVFNLMDWTDAASMQAVQLNLHAQEADLRLSDAAQRTFGQSATGGWLGAGQTYQTVRQSIERAKEHLSGEFATLSDAQDKEIMRLQKTSAGWRIVPHESWRKFDVSNLRFTSAKNRVADEILAGKLSTAEDANDAVRRYAAEVDRVLGSVGVIDPVTAAGPATQPSAPATRPAMGEKASRILDELTADAVRPPDVEIHCRPGTQPGRTYVSVDLKSRGGAGDGMRRELVFVPPEGLRQLVRFMANRGLLERAMDRTEGGKAWETSPGPRYFILLVAARQTYWIDLGWGLPMLHELQALRDQVDGTAAKAMDKLLAGLEPESKAWENASAAKPASESYSAAETPAIAGARADASGIAAPPSSAPAPSEATTRPAATEPADGADGLERLRKQRLKELITAQKLHTWVEDFFQHNSRDITDRKTIEWGEPQTTPLGNLSIRYKYEATIGNKDHITSNKLFTFTPTGEFVSVKDAE